jgi:hypothetical protein
MQQLSQRASGVMKLVGGAGQQPPSRGSDMGGCGGQLTAVLVLMCAEAADAAVLTPPAARVGGTPLTQSGSVQAPAAATAGDGPPLHAGELVQAPAAGI